MSLAGTASAFIAAADLRSPVVAALNPSHQGLVFLVGVAFMLLGLYLRWRLPHERMVVEEYAKERRITERQARQRVQLVRFGGPVAVLLGVAAFATIFLE